MTLLSSAALCVSAQAGIFSEMQASLLLANTQDAKPRKAPLQLKSLAPAFNAQEVFVAALIAPTAAPVLMPANGGPKTTATYGGSLPLKTLVQPDEAKATFNATKPTSPAGHLYEALPVARPLTDPPIAAKELAIPFDFKEMIEALLVNPVAKIAAMAPNSTKITRLPAVYPKDYKPTAEASGSKPVFSASTTVAPGIGSSISEKEAAIRIAASKPNGGPDTKVSIVASNVDLNRVLGILSDQTKANLVLLVPTDVKLTVRLSGVKFIDALRHICTLSGLSFVIYNGAYILGPSDKLKAGYPAEWDKLHPEDPSTPPKNGVPVNNGNPNPTNTTSTPPAELIDSATFRTNYIDAQALADSIKALLGEANIQAAAGPAQISPSLSDRDTQGATGVSQGLIQTEIKGVSRTLILRGPRSMVKDAIKIAHDLDVPRPQVAIAVTIHDITDSALNELGISWTLGGFNVSESQGKGVNFGTFSRSGLNFQAALKGLEQTDKAKLLASPNVRVMDRERAFVLIGSRLKFPVVSSYSTNGTPIVTTQEEKVGVYLQVAPQIADDGTIILTLYPQVSTVVSFAQIGGGSYPQIDSREAQTTLRLKSGDTIVIGGLYKDEELRKIEKIPILASIPFLGELFTNRRRTKSSSQVIITLSVTLVDPV